jgi:hypothetical protein
MGGLDLVAVRQKKYPAQQLGPPAGAQGAWRNFTDYQNILSMLHVSPAFACDN